VLPGPACAGCGARRVSTAKPPLCLLSRRGVASNATSLARPGVTHQPLRRHINRKPTRIRLCRCIHRQNRTFAARLRKFLHLDLAVAHRVIHEHDGAQAACGMGLSDRHRIGPSHGHAVAKGAGRTRLWFGAHVLSTASRLDTGWRLGSHHWVENCYFSGTRRGHRRLHR
jgi:hypothetical protein